MTATFSALRIALALGKSKRAVQLALRDTKAGGCLIVKGQQIDAWRIDQLPVRFVEELQSVARTRGYRTAEHLLSDPPRRWVPIDAAGASVPLREIAQSQVERAARIRSALARTLQLKDKLEDPEQRLSALTEFRRQYGNSSERHWRRLLKRTIQRDAGENRFEDIVLYLDEIVTRRPEARQKITIGQTAAERTVLDALGQVRNLSNPTFDEAARIWLCVGEFIDDAITMGGIEKRARHRIYELLANSRVALSRNDGESIKKLIKRKYQSWCEGGRTVEAVEDKRQKKFGKSGWHRAPDIKKSGDLDKIVAETLINCGSRLSDGVRSLRESGQLSPDFCAHYTATSNDLSYVPSTVRRAARPELKRLQRIHQGPRAHKLAGAYHQIDWSNVAAGDWMSADDTTPPVYFWQHRDGRNSVMRGQLLVAIDERTTMVLGLVLIAERGYTSAHIFNLFTDVFSNFGLPRVGLILENGLWRRSRLVKGRRDANTNDIADLGLRRLVGRIVHTRLPRGKNVERVFGLLQNPMERLPGYSSRNERMVRNERFEKLKLDIEAGRVDPAQHLFDQDQLVEQYTRICELYNDTPQQGVKLAGLTPRQAWKQLQSTPLTRFDDSSLWLLSSDPQKCTIDQRHGIQLTIPTIGKVRYVGAETGRRAGEQVLAWVNTRRPEVLCCTTLDKKEVFTLERYNPLDNRVDASNFETEDAKLKAHNAYATDRYRTLRNILDPHHYGPLFVDPWTKRTGEKMRAQEKKISVRRRSEDQLDRAVASKAKRAGLSPIIVHHSPDSVNSMERLAALEAELELGVHDEKALQSAIGDAGGNGVKKSRR